MSNFVPSCISGVSLRAVHTCEIRTDSAPNTNSARRAEFGDYGRDSFQIHGGMDKRRHYIQLISLYNSLAFWMALQFLKCITLQWYFYKTGFIFNTHLTVLENWLESPYNDEGARCGQNMEVPEEVLVYLF